MRRRTYSAVHGPARSNPFDLCLARSGSRRPRRGRGRSGGTGGADAGGSKDAGTSTVAASFFKSTCECPVLTGFTNEQFCQAYTEICGYMGTGRYKDEAHCMSKFKGGSSDADGKKAGALCCAFKMPDMKESRSGARRRPAPRAPRSAASP
jgi:hypothetical protein